MKRRGSSGKIAPKKKIITKPKKGKRRKKVVKLKEIGMEMDKIYAIISECQIDRTDQTIIVDPLDHPVIENILKDSEMKFQKSKKSDGIHYKIQPPPKIEIPEEDYVYDEELENELMDEGQCF